MILIHPHRSRSFLVFLLIGLTLRLWNLPDPIVDAMSPRQAQTADAIRSLIEEPGFQIDSNASWRGTGGARIVQELPAYSILTQGVYEAIDSLFFETNPPKEGGADPHLIDISGHLVSVVFWTLAFVLLQGIWQRFLSPRETLWANGVFVLAPLSVFFGQTVMPEMLFLALATGFVVAVLRYGEIPSIGRFGSVFFCAVLACLIKLPAFSHLGLLAIALLWRSRGFVFLLRPIHWLAMVLLLASLKEWGGYVTAVNAAAFPDWTSEASLAAFFGDPGARLKVALYVKVVGYIVAFILSPLGAVFALIGLWQAWNRRTSDAGFFALAWAASLIFFVLVWGTQTASAHSYYNLPMLIPSAMLFGLGFDASYAWLKAKRGQRLAVTFASVAAILVTVPMALMGAYLFREEKIMMTAADWIRQNIPPGQPVALKLNHNPHYIDYMHVPTVAYYSGRPCFMLTKFTPKQEYAAAMQQCSIIVETLPAGNGSMKDFAVAFKGASRPVDTLDKARDAGFAPSESDKIPGLRFWKKNPAPPVE